MQAGIGALTLPALTWRHLALAAIALLNVYLLAVLAWEWRFWGGEADWNTISGAALADDPFTFGGWRWSPLAAELLRPIAHLPYAGWALLHVAAVLLLRPRWMIVVLLLAWPFWRDVMQGNTLTFVFVAAWMATTQRSTRWTVVYFVLLGLMPRPLMMPVAAWLLWKHPESRWPAALTLGIVAIATLGVGQTDDWIARLLVTSDAHYDHRANWLPSRLIGAWWVPIGLALSAFFVWRGRLGLASVAVNPYSLTYYWIMLLLELRSRTDPNPRPG